MDPDTLTRERAYQLWQQAGCPDGRGEEFWFAAQRIVAAEAAAPGRTAPAKKTAAHRRAGSAVSARTGAAASDAAVTKTATSNKPSRARVDRVPT